MPREIEKLSAIGVTRLKEPGYYADGAGLYLQIGPTGSKSWLFRYRYQGKPKWMGLGAVDTFSLAEARDRARTARQALSDGVDPIERRAATRAAEAAAARAAQMALTFEQAANRYIKAHEADWKNAKHAQQWRNTIDTYAMPVLGQMPTASIDTDDVMRVLEPIWKTKTETATRLRARIEKVLDLAKEIEKRGGENPAQWRGKLSLRLGRPGRIARVVNHPALAYAEIGDFMTELRAQPGIAALTLEFIILTAARTSEVIGAKWSEFDLDAGVWTIPPERMKADKEHRVPLSVEALEVLTHVHALGSEFVFPGRNPEQGQSNMTCLELMRRMNAAYDEPRWLDPRTGEQAVPHGFRSTFRDWAAECTAYPNHVVEMALAHTIGDKVEAAYRRGELLAKRAALMQEWADYCAKVRPKAKVMSIRQAGG